MWRIKDNLDASHLELDVCLGGWRASVVTEAEIVNLPWEQSEPRTAAGSFWRLEMVNRAEAQFSIEGRLTWQGENQLRLEKVVLQADVCVLGRNNARWSFFKNGYQSWSESRAFQANEVEHASWLKPMNILQSNPRNPPKNEIGAFTGEMFALLGNLDERLYLLVGQGKRREQFVYVNAWLPGKTRKSACLELVYDFGGRFVNPGETVVLDEVWGIAGRFPGELLEQYLTCSASDHPLPTCSPAGWCSWYYYYTKITADSIQENLDQVVRHKPDWQVFVIDDGYQTAVGDWLCINEKFPQGLTGLAAQARGNGLRAGLWIAPFVARGNSALFREHPDWVLRNARGKPQLAGWNPNWGLEGRFYGLDTTHPGFQAYLKKVIRTVVHEWGFNYLKLDFVYGACLPGHAHDSSMTAAQRLSLGYQLVREAAGEDVFLLGCGSPFGPAQGWVDGMRIGPDVAPYWDDPLRTRWTRDPHALCTRTAVRSIMARSVFHRRWWLNDPDCLMLRDTETKLTDAERFTLAAAAAVTGGLLFFSDRLSALPEKIWESMSNILEIARSCDGQPAKVIGFMEGEFPTAVWNLAGYLAVFNFHDQEKEVVLQTGDFLEDGIELWDVIDDRAFRIEHGTLNAGILPAHGTRLLSNVKPEHRGNQK